MPLLWETGESCSLACLSAPCPESIRMQLADEHAAEAAVTVQEAPPYIEDRIDTLGQVIADLALLNHNTEQDFLESAGNSPSLSIR